MALELKIPGVSFKKFASDTSMNNLTLSATNGTTMIYNLPTALKHYAAEAKRKLKLGMDKKIVYLYMKHLSSVDPNHAPRVSQSIFSPA